MGNGLQQLGIRQVKGDLMITGQCAMNYQTHPLKAGELLKIGLEQAKWSKETQKAFQSLPSGTQAPQVKILGMVRASQIRHENARLLLRHQSLTLTELLRKMNIYRNNVM